MFALAVATTAIIPRLSNLHSIQKVLQLGIIVQGCCECRTRGSAPLQPLQACRNTPLAPPPPIVVPTGPVVIMPPQKTHVTHAQPIAQPIGAPVDAHMQHACSLPPKIAMHASEACAAALVVAERAASKRMKEIRRRLKHATVLTVATALVNSDHQIAQISSI